MLNKKKLDPYMGLTDAQKKTVKKAVAAAKRKERKDANAKRRKERGDMEALDHFRELKKRFFRCVIITVMLSLIPLYFSDYIIGYLIRYGMDAGYTFITETAQEVIMSEISVALRIGIVLSLPAWLYNIFAFFIPEKSRLYHMVIVHLITFFFILGIEFSIRIIYPFMLAFFAGETGKFSGITLTVSVNEYTSFFLTVCTIFGILLEMPLVTTLLVKLDILSTEVMKKGRVYVIVVMAILAGLVTPPDVASLIMVLLPMVGLYEICIIISILMKKKKATA